MGTNSTIRAIAIHPAANTAMPTLVDQGSNIDWTTAGFTRIGTLADAEAGICLKEDTVTRGFERLYSAIQCDTGGAAEDHVLKRIAALDFEFLVFTARDELLALDSNLSTTGSVTDHTYTTTKRTLAVEINGEGTVYYPQVVIAVDQMEGAVSGDDAGNVYKVMVMVEGTTAIPMGAQFHEYQPGV